MPKKADRGRGRRRRAMRQLLEVVCEGEGERLWFQHLKQKLNAATGEAAGPELRVSRGQRGDAWTRWRHAVRDRDRTGLSGPWWLVNDTEPHDPAKVAKLREALAAAENSADGTIVLSHPCFEVWLFCLLPASAAAPLLDNPSAYVAALSAASVTAGGRAYESKTDDVWLSKTLGRLDAAAEKAARLRGSRAEFLAPEGSHEPFTEVHDLVTKLQAAFNDPAAGPSSMGQSPRP